MKGKTKESQAMKTERLETVKFVQIATNSNNDLFALDENGKIWATVLTGEFKTWYLIESPKEKPRGWRWLDEKNENSGDNSG